MIPLPKEPKVEKKGENKSVFTVEALYPGYGTTVGNSLRRVLLSSMKGAAITEVKIEDMPHEFSTLPGVKEDGVTILLNLKEVRFRMFEQGPFTASLDVEGEKEVTASDFKLPSQLEVVNGDRHIATITEEKGSLNLEAKVSEGVGYEQVKEEKRGGEIGAIRLDAVYSPVKKVSFRVENMRVGERTDFDRLVLVVETDGGMSPEQAFGRAAEILEKHFSKVKVAEEEKPCSEEPTEGEKEKEEEAEEEEKIEPSEITVEELDIPSRVVNILQENRIKSIAGLVARSEQNIAGMEGIGPKSLEKIKKELEKLGLELK